MLAQIPDLRLCAFMSPCSYVGFRSGGMSYPLHLLQVQLKHVVAKADK